MARTREELTNAEGTAVAVRYATEADLPAVRDIHNQRIADRTTLDTVPCTLEQKLHTVSCHLLVSHDILASLWHNRC